MLICVVASPFPMPCHWIIRFLFHGKARFLKNQMLLGFFFGQFAAFFFGILSRFILLQIYDELVESLFKFKLLTCDDEMLFEFNIFNR